MNSDLIPSSQVSASDSQKSPTETVAEENQVSRQQPIPPPSEPLQYRAIGLVRGRYQASAEQFTQGTLLAHDGTQLQAVLLGRVISLVRKHIDLDTEHLWVVYPRTGQQDNHLHLQIVGVWEPETLAKQATPEDAIAASEATPSEAKPQPMTDSEDGYFSIRGEVVFQSAGDSRLVVKIKQAPRKESERPKFFKVNLQGVLKTKAVGQFWDFHVLRQADNLVVQKAESIATLPKPFKKPIKKPFNPRSGGGGYNKGGGGKTKFDTPRPVRKTDSSTPMPQKPLPKAPLPKPTKRPKPPQE
jgi:hypothetical protein